MRAIPTGAMRSSVCGLCMTPVTEEEHRTGVREQRVTWWVPVPHAAGCGRPCIAGGVEAARSVVMDGPAKRRFYEALATVYGSGGIARVAADAGLNLSRIDTSGAPREAWFAVVEEAVKMDRIEALRAIARSEYPSIF